MLFAMGQFYREISSFGYSKKLEKSQNKVGTNLFGNFIEHLQSKVNKKIIKS